MKNQNDARVFQLDNGLWGYRYTFTREGKRYSRQGRKDESGEPLRNKRSALKARKLAFEQEMRSFLPDVAPGVTVKEVYHEYCESGRNDRAFLQHFRKQRCT